jgi:small redox-active disulfide protein 2
MRIEILGPGCPRCSQTMENAKEALKLIGKEAEVVKIIDFKKMLEYGITSTPALVIDGEVKCAGKVPSIDEIAQWIYISGPCCSRF